MRGIARVVAGLLSREHSVATGLLIALTVWTLTRLVDGITGSSTVEYDVRYTTTALADGERVSRVEVTLTNLADDETLTGLTAAVSDPRLKAVFIQPPECRFAPPSWVERAECRVTGPKEGFLFTAPTLVSGSRAWFAVNYRGSVEEPGRPVVRIKAGEKLRLVTPGIVTFIVRNESALLLSLLGLTLILLVLSVGVGIQDARAGEREGRTT
jgi:hypothetical protein